MDGRRLDGTAPMRNQGDLASVRYGSIFSAMFKVGAFVIDQKRHDAAP
jgi:hypothetical protein